MTSTPVAAISSSDVAKLGEIADSTRMKFGAEASAIIISHAAVMAKEFSFAGDLAVKHLFQLLLEAAIIKMGNTHVAHAPVWKLICDLRANTPVAVTFQEKK